MKRKLKLKKIKIYIVLKKKIKSDKNNKRK